MADEIICDVLIIGAGPAGMGALETLGGHDCSVVVVDEQAGVGGQIYRQPPAEFNVKSWMSNRIYRTGLASIRRAEVVAGVTWYFETTVLGIFETDVPEDGFSVWLSTAGRSFRVRARRVLLATGCYDMPVPFPGWTLPGVMATGGIQAFVKSQQFIAGDNFVFVGSHPLQLIVADQVVAAGGSVKAVVFSQPWWSALKVLMAPWVLIRRWRNFALVAAALFRLRRRGVDIRFSRYIRAATGMSGVEGVQLDDGTLIPCERLGICYGFLPQSELARQVGAEVQWDFLASGGWTVNHDQWMESTLPGFFVAGEVTGVAGAEVSAQEGRLAGLGLLKSLGKLPDKQVRKASAIIRKRLRPLSRFAALLRKLARPPENALDDVPDAGTLICRCESVSYDAFRAMLSGTPSTTSADGAKLLTRTGMGMCQGRYCARSVMREISRMRKSSIESVGGFRCRPPVKPVPISDLISGK